jgi:bis(5'-nucleosyl)-tetraphosphatase (symmetrical)
VATYAIGDVQGCYRELCSLLELLKFDPKEDQVWFLGDLINRGHDNLAVVNLVMSLGKAARTVLGNHDLHFLAIVFGGHTPNRSDTFQDILDAKTVMSIAEWYCQQSMLVKDEKLGFVMTHAGIPHLWNLEQAAVLAAEVETVISSGKQRRGFFADMYGNEPAGWSDKLKGMDRLRAITNYLTRMRLMSKDGTLDFAHKGPLSEAPENLYPWYELRAKNPLGVTTLFGHWAALEGVTNTPDVIALDTGCVWGRELSALCLETGKITRVAAVTG